MNSPVPAAGTPRRYCSQPIQRPKEFAPGVSGTPENPRTGGICPWHRPC